VKLFLWPLLIWAFVIGRRRATGQAVLILGVSSLLVWLPILGSIVRYPSLLHQLAVHEAWAGYGLAGIAAAAGVSHASAALVATCAAPLAAVATWQFGRRLSERRALAATVAISVVVSPVVWEHYFALAFVCIALCWPTLSPAWFMPLALWLIPGQQAWASLWRISLAVAVLAVPLLFRSARQLDRSGRKRLTDQAGIVST
jgi:hypothetical protein